MTRALAIACLCLALTACGGGSSKTTTTSSKSGGYTTPQPQESVGVYKVGTPYWVAGQQYFPKEDPNYDEVGIASWYGSKFHGKRTANGEIFDMHQLSAAHKTLPMPSMVEVTNLENGRSVIVRVNDRGPFVDDRIIDMSYKGAQLLGFERQGIARVRVKYHGPAMGAAAKPQVTNVELAPLDGPTPAESIYDQPPRSATGQDIYIQAGSFSSPDNAYRLKGNVSQYYDSQVREVTVNGQRFYRVHLGPFPDVQSANAVHAQLQSAGFPGARIMFDISTP